MIMEARDRSDYPADLTPEHDKRGASPDDTSSIQLLDDVVAAYNYVEAVINTSDYVRPPAWHGWALREAFLAGISHAENKTNGTAIDHILVDQPKKRIYISGPMTGIPAFNFPAFHAEAGRLRALGYEVVNPAELNPDTTMSWHECMRSDLAALLTCDTLALMDGWQKSAGAHLEMHVAHRVGMEIVIAQEIAA